MKLNFVVLQKLEKLSKNPFLHNDFLYNRLMKSTINFYQRTLHKQSIFLKDKIEWIESQYFHWLTKLIKILQYFSSSDLVPMKQEVANIFNWFQNFTKYLDGMKLLEFPTFIKKGRKKSTEIMEIDKMSNSALTRKERSPKEVSSTDLSNINLIQPDLSSNQSKFDITITKLSKLGHTSLIINPTTNFQQGTELDIDPNGVDVFELTQKRDSSKINYEPLTAIPRISQNFSNIDISSHINKNLRMLPKIDKRDHSMLDLQTEKNQQKNRKLSNGYDDEIRMPNFRIKKESLQVLSNHSSLIGASDSESIDNKNSLSVSSDNTLENQIKKPEDLRKKYLMEAPLQFKMNAPPKIVDLTSDFFEKDTDQIQVPALQMSVSKFQSTQSPQKINSQNQIYNKRPQRVIINNPRQNAQMIELGKRKIYNLKNFYGKMMSEVLMREFEVMFAPLDENQDNQDYLDISKGGNQPQAQTPLNQTQGANAPGFVRDDTMTTSHGQDNQSSTKNGIFEFKASGISMIRRTAQDDYRYQQLNEIQDLKGLLVKKGVNLNHKVLQRAILMPEDQILDSSCRRYPQPSDGLMENPFPKKIKGGKKKKKKRRVRTLPSMDFQNI